MRAFLLALCLFLGGCRSAVPRLPPKLPADETAFSDHSRIPVGLPGIAAPMPSGAVAGGERPSLPLPSASPTPGVKPASAVPQISAGTAPSHAAKPAAMPVALPGMAMAKAGGPETGTGALALPAPGTNDERAVEMDRKTRTQQDREAELQTLRRAFYRFLAVKPDE